MTKPNKQQESCLKNFRKIWRGIPKNKTTHNNKN